MIAPQVVIRMPGKGRAEARVVSKDAATERSSQPPVEFGSLSSCNAFYSLFSNKGKIYNRNLKRNFGK